MYVKAVRTRRKGREFLYAQLVKSVRRKSDGKPTIKVVASLGRVTEEELENLRVTFKANSAGERVTVLPRTPPSVEVRENLRFLDVAVVLHMLRECGAMEVLESHLAGGSSDVSIASVIAALVVQRCVQPGSKLAATRWLPKTAAPELLGIPRESLTNTRVHRALSALESTEVGLKQALRAVLARAQPEGSFVVVFLDATDAWFEGIGPPSASVGRTKEGMFRKKVGVALLCDQDGLPVAWETFAGDSHEAEPMLKIAREVAQEKCVEDVPVVVDRGLGWAAYLTALDDAGVSFVANVPSSEFGVYGCDRLTEPLDGLLSDKAEAATEVIQEAGFVPIGDERFVLDLGNVERPRSYTKREKVPRSQANMVQAEQLKADLKAGVASSTVQLAEVRGLSKAQVSRLLSLAKLPKRIRQSIAAGETPTAKMRELYELVGLPSDAQSDAFEKLKRRKGRPLLVTRSRDNESPLSVRAVACFNLDQFRNQRSHAIEREKELLSRLEDLNARLASRPRAEGSALGAAASLFKRSNVLSMYDLELKTDDGIQKVTVQRKEDVWTARRRKDGLSLLVASPNVPGSAEQLNLLYRSRSIIESDFREVKSVLALRPVRHYTNAKVRAHVSICILGLLINRVLERKLPGRTASQALTELGTCHLNRLSFGGEHCTYALTTPTKAQRDILAALDADHLVDAEEIRVRFSPT